MRYTTLGRTGITVSTICMGTMTFGREADEDTCSAIFARCRDAGANFLDCADIYAAGRSEEILGRLIRDCRDELVITSKVGQSVGEGTNTDGLSRRHIVLEAENSLRRLGTDWLDIYFCHCEDPRTPVDETLAAMDALVSQGKVRYVGVSNWHAWLIARALGRSESLGLTPIHVIQPMYSLIKRTAEVEMLPLAQAEGLGVIPYSPLGAGMLTGKYFLDSTDGSRLRTNTMYAARYADPSYIETARRFCAYAEGIGVAPATLAVAWVKAHPAVTAPIIGARSVEQLEASLAAGDYEMSPEQWRAISDLSPPVPIATDRDEERG